MAGNKRRTNAEKLVCTKKSAAWIKQLWLLINEQNVKGIEEMVCKETKKSLVEVGTLKFPSASNGSVLHVAVDTENFNVIEYVCQKFSVDVNALNKHQFSVLHMACKKQNVQLVENLLLRNVRLDLVDKHGQSALDYMTFDTFQAVVLNRLNGQNALLYNGRKNAEELVLQMTQTSSKLKEEYAAKQIVLKDLEHSLQEHRLQYVGELASLKSNLCNKIARVKQNSRVLAENFQDEKCCYEELVEDLELAVIAEDKAKEKRNLASVALSDENNNLAEIMTVVEARQVKFHDLLGVVYVMESNLPSQQVQVWGCLMCSLLTSDLNENKYHRILVSQGFIDVLSKSLVMHVSSIRIQEYGIRALGNILSVVEDVRQEVINLGFLGIIMQRIDKYSKDCNMIEVCVKALAGLLSNFSQVSRIEFSADMQLDLKRALLTKASIIQILSLTQHAKLASNEEFISNICLIIYAILIVNGKNTVVENGGVDALLEIIVEYQFHHEIALHVVASLALIANLHASIVNEKMMMNDTLELVLQLFSFYENDPSINFWALSLFHALGSKDEQARTDLQDLEYDTSVLKCLKTFRSHGMLQVMCIRTLYIVSVCDYDERNNLNATSEGILHGIVETLQHAPIQSSLEEWTTRAMATMAGNADNKKLLFDSFGTYIERCCRILYQPVINNSVLSTLRLMIGLFSYMKGLCTTDADGRGYMKISQKHSKQMQCSIKRLVSNDPRMQPTSIPMDNQVFLLSQALNKLL